jgi:hypothetical protein
VLYAIVHYVAATGGSTTCSRALQRELSHRIPDVTVVYNSRWYHSDHACVQRMIGSTASTSARRMHMEASKCCDCGSMSLRSCCCNLTWDPAGKYQCTCSHCGVCKESCTRSCETPLCSI